MEICPTIPSFRAARAGLSGTVALVPTMGYLHEGHLSLVRRAQSAADHVLATIFVNPTQFGPNEDLSSYPRDMDRDLRLLKAEGVAAVFTPDPSEMYPEGAETTVDVPSLSGILQGALRPGHFQGVATVVTKLFNIAQPDVAVFGEKDFQQLTLIRRMVRDLNQPLRIIGAPTVREADGLAMSSRNARLTPEDRAAAVVLNQGLNAAEAHEGQSTTVEALRAIVHDTIASEPRATIASIEVRDAITLDPISGPLTAPAVILLAVRFGDVLLIDQRVIGPGKDQL